MRNQKVQKAQQLILTADRMNKQLYSRLGQRLGVHRSQHMVLMYLSRPDVIASQKEIADIFEISPPAVAMLLKRLEKNGYIMRESSPEDNRCNIITLTEKGRKIAEETKQMGDACNSVAYTNFSDEEIDTFINLMEKIQGNLKKFLEDEEAKYS